MKNNDVDDALGDCCVEQLNVEVALSAEVALRDVDDPLRDVDLKSRRGCGAVCCVDDWHDVELALGEQLVLHFWFELALIIFSYFPDFSHF